MEIVFYISAAVAIVATVMVITSVHAIHALLYTIVSLLAVALVFYVLGAPFVAALEVIIYAGAIMVLFVFVVMMLNLGAETVAEEWMGWSPTALVGAAILALILLGELAYMLVAGGYHQLGGSAVEPKQVGIALFGPYVLGAELASTLLLAGLVGAYHLGRRQRSDE